GAAVDPAAMGGPLVRAGRRWAAAAVRGDGNGQRGGRCVRRPVVVAVHRRGPGPLSVAPPANPYPPTPPPHPPPSFCSARSRRTPGSRTTERVGGTEPRVGGAGPRGGGRHRRRRRGRAPGRAVGRGPRPGRPVERLDAGPVRPGTAELSERAGAAR